ncbi:MAG: RIP metalloprotease, partial [Acidimicrobiales bacterium]
MTTLENPQDTEASEVDASEDSSFGGVGLALLVGALAVLGWFSPWALVMVLAIVFIIFLHELAHYVTARRSGMKVTEFFIGFGPVIWSFRRGETRYGVKAIWAGAYVRIIGMNNLDDVEPEDEDRTYRSKSTGARVMVASAGSLMHFTLALLLFFVLFVGYGIPTNETDEASWLVAEVTQDSAADGAGLVGGDKVVAIDGVAIRNWDDLVTEIQSQPNTTVLLTVERDGETFTAVTTIGEREGSGFLGVRPSF